jgi:hypothetical protein
VEVGYSHDEIASGSVFRAAYDRNQYYFGATASY